MKFARRTRMIRVVALQTVLTGGQQLVAVVTGLLLIRAFDKPEYAAYVLVANGVTSMASLGDCGVTATLYAKGGAALSNGVNVGNVLKSANRFRLFSTGAACAIWSPLTFYLIVTNEADLIEALVLTIGSITVAWFTSKTLIYLVVVRLYERYTAANLILLGGALGRLVIVGCILALDRASLVSVVLIIAAVSYLEARVSRRAALSRLTESVEDRPFPLSGFKSNAIRSAPVSVFYVIHGQLAILILAAYGDSASLAEIYAVGRYAVVFAILAGAVSQVATTRMSRADTQRVSAVWSKSVCLYAVVAGLTYVVGHLASGPALGILGAGYADLDLEYRLMLAGGAVGQFAALLANLNNSRAYLRSNWLTVPISASWMFVLLAVSPPEDAQSAAVYASLSPLGWVSAALVVGCRNWRSERRMTSIEAMGGS